MSEPIIKFRAYQRPVFEDNETGILVLHWSRQIGKSFTLAAWAVYRLLSRPGRLVTVLSNSKDNGTEFALKCAEVCRKFEKAKKKVIEEHNWKDLSTSLAYEDMRFEITIKVKVRGEIKIGRIKVLAANPRTARGFSGDLILDEFAFHEDSAAIWDAAEPILSSNPDFLCRIASTGNGTSNMFYRMATEGLYKVSRVRRSDAWRMGVKIYDAKTRKPITPEEARAQALDKASYDQNYECAFASETGSLLTNNLINAAVDPDAPIFDFDGENSQGREELAVPSEALTLLDEAERRGHVVYVGGDVAYSHNYAVYSFGDLDGATLKTLFIARIHGSRLPQQRRFLKPLLNHSAVERAALDESGLGLGLVQDLEDEDESPQCYFKIQGINFAQTEPISDRMRHEGRREKTVRITELMANDLSEMHDDHRITYPCDAIMREDLRKPMKIRNGSRVSIAAESTKTGHADHFWSLALMVRAATHSTTKPAMQATAQMDDLQEPHSRRSLFR